LGSYITTTDVHVRKGPGTKFEVVATIPKGVKVAVVGREDHWLRIESKHGNKPGYIDEQYARPLTAQQAPQNKTVVASVTGPYKTIREIDLREGPGSKYKTLTKLPAGIKINVVGAEGEWLRVESKHGGKPGYVDKRDVERWTQR
jgi:uncharacterized protein YgiM (DUF1202 family)